jgi:hypothetical protein
LRQAGLRPGLPEAVPGSVPAEAVLPAQAGVQPVPAEAGVLRPGPVPAEAVLQPVPTGELLPEAGLPATVRPDVLPEAGLLQRSADLQHVLHERLLDARLLPAQVQGEAVRPV